MYRPNVGILIINDNKQIFAGHRRNAPAEKGYQMPQGGVESGDNEVDSMYKELYEETGLQKKSVELIVQYPKKIRYHFPEYILIKMKYKYKNNLFLGQEQTWFILKFIGQESDINLKIEQKPEFDNWKWLDCEALLKQCIHFKRKTYEEIFKYCRSLNLL